ncbi:flagellar FlbD family protein [Halobacillus halophilus]|nr:flagellar FlbD family protein [Halobacillus halophilus]MCA1009241.1 flagellar FlbD family protein [Halobacillus halophilus]
MIALTKLNGDPFTLNAIYIEQIQSNPDTMITTTQGKKLLVKEQEEIVVKKIKRFYREVGLFRLAGQAGDDD